ncbi:carcinoembryonic antigen-related cell adhesion molecule 3-like [Lacerta agilis]|uniref:carcinoembryonic antigen-related cell adhesion molecule 3-like n=1 Tax=Lacerta agilis TaxID=80427 RepID=UPI0014197D1E|nr:carcinoembryonic antigen-related cell adhesion molecule 3-like [Lacerta agilis]
MGLPNSRQGAQKAMLLTGFLLSCMLQLVPAQFQPQLSLTPEPHDPLVGRDVKLSLEGAPRQFVQCQWFRQSRSGRAEQIFTHFGQSQRQPERGRGHTGRETLRDGCSLYITRLTQSDTGNYTVVMQIDQNQQTGQGQQFLGRNYSVSYYLHISSLISIILNPQRPVQGQDLTLTPQNAPKQFSFCHWLILSSRGNEKVLEYNPKDRDQQSSSQDRVTLRRDCSLQIRQLDISDTGNYTVRIESPLDQQQQPGQGTFPQEPQEGNIQVHKGQLYIDVLRQSGHDPQKGRAPGSLTYSAAVVAGTVLGSLAWADALTPVFSGLFCSLTSRKRKVVP